MAWLHHWEVVFLEEESGSFGGDNEIRVQEGFSRDADRVMATFKD
jgi:hypothetical protein